MKEKALVTIYSSKDLKNFLAFYALGYEEYQWSAIVKDDLKLKELCDKSEIFDTIILNDARYDNIKMKEKMILFMQMTGAWLCGKAQSWRNKFIRRYVEYTDYSLIVVASGEGGILNGALLSKARQKCVVILEDGLQDYDNRKVHLTEVIFNPNKLASYILAKMNYVDFCGDFHLKSTLFCDKYVTHPELVERRFYHKVYQLYDKEKFDKNLFAKYINQVFDLVCGEIKGDILLLTMPIDELGEYASLYKKKIEGYISKNYCNKNVLIKKHPRDNQHYDFGENIQITYISQDIPGELIVESIECDSVLMMRPGNMCFCFEDYKVLHCAEFDDVYTNRGKRWGDMFWELCNVSRIGLNQIIEIK